MKKKTQNKQIHFYLGEEDEQMIAAYLQERGYVVLAYANTQNAPLICENLTDQTDFSVAWRKFWALETLLSEVKMVFNEKRNLYFVDNLYSPTIEWQRSIWLKENNTVSRGRIYYQTGFYTENGEWIEKNPLFGQSATQIFQWFKKNFTKSELAHGNYVGLSALALAQEGGILKAF